MNEFESNALHIPCEKRWLLKSKSAQTLNSLRHSVSTWGNHLNVRKTFAHAQWSCIFHTKFLNRKSEMKMIHSTIRQRRSIRHWKQAKVREKCKVCVYCIFCVSCSAEFILPLFDWYFFICFCTLAFFESYHGRSSVLGSLFSFFLFIYSAPQCRLKMCFCIAIFFDWVSIQMPLCRCMTSDKEFSLTYRRSRYLQ